MTGDTSYASSVNKMDILLAIVKDPSSCSSYAILGVVAGLFLLWIYNSYA